MAAAYASVKVTSVYLGPEGIGVFSQFHYITSMVLGMAAGSTNTAVVRLMGEYAGDPDRIRVLLGTIARTLAAVGVAISLSFVALSPWIAERMLDGSQWAVFVMLFGLSYLAGLMHCFLLAVANGSKDYRTITFTNISCIVVNLLLIVVVCPIYGLTGALAVAALSPLFMAALAYFWAFRRAWMPHRVLRSTDGCVRRDALSGWVGGPGKLKQPRPRSALPHPARAHAPLLCPTRRARPRSGCATSWLSTTAGPKWASCRA